METEKTIKVTVCDVCGGEIYPSYGIISQTCLICKKDVCPRCAIFVSIANERTKGPVCPGHIPPQTLEAVRKG